MATEWWPEPSRVVIALERMWAEAEKPPFGFSHMVELPEHYSGSEKVSEARAWLKRNVMFWREKNPNPDEEHMYIRYRFYFTFKKDAVLFKLFWC